MSSQYRIFDWQVLSEELHVDFVNVYRYVCVNKSRTDFMYGQIRPTTRRLWPQNASSPVSYNLCQQRCQI